ncbi:hypothetical protein D3C75_853680 [compost metagenome]
MFQVIRLRRHIQLHEPLVHQPLQRYPVHIRVARVIQRLTDHIIFGVAECLCIKTHRPPKQRKDLHIALAFSRRIHHRLLKLHIVMPVGAV